MKRPSRSFISKGLEKNMMKTYKEQGLTEEQIQEAIRIYSENQKDAEIKKVDRKLRELYG